MPRFDLVSSGPLLYRNIVHWNLYIVFEKSSNFVSSSQVHQLLKHTLREHLRIIGRGTLSHILAESKSAQSGSKSV